MRQRRSGGRGLLPLLLVWVPVCRPRRRRSRRWFTPPPPPRRSGSGSGSRRRFWGRWGEVSGLISGWLRAVLFLFSRLVLRTGGSFFCSTRHGKAHVAWRASFTGIDSRSLLAQPVDERGHGRWQWHVALGIVGEMREWMGWDGMDGGTGMATMALRKSQRSIPGTLCFSAADFFRLSRPCMEGFSGSDYRSELEAGERAMDGRCCILSCGRVGVCGGRCMDNNNEREREKQVMNPYILYFHFHFHSAVRCVQSRYLDSHSRHTHPYMGD